MTRDKHIVFISWEQHRRTRELARALDARLIEVLSSGEGVRRYPRLLIRTVYALLAARPAHLIVQCPSVVLAILAVLLRPFFRFRLVLDLHNEAVEPFINKSSTYRRALRFLHRSADVCVVTTSALGDAVRASRGNPVVLPDRIPRMTPVEATSPTAVSEVVFICTFAPDEPVSDVLAAAALIGDRILLYVTGRRPSSFDARVPANVRFTGFLPEADYEQLLSKARVIIDLTSMQNCLVCGAYEAVALHRPLVTSDTAALRAYFRRGTVYTLHDAASIAAAVHEALDRSAVLHREMRSLREALEREWNLAFAALRKTLQTTSRREKSLVSSGFSPARRSTR